MYRLEIKLGLKKKKDFDKKEEGKFISVIQSTI
jgi:hypothetical protein